ncbi:TRAP transporter substrate-binding protein [Shumkonia mesophila]|uniref:TRAP transporter substrate-binding protein n=1 Tax=Shumkonia mesophila TaxID=2838854 RepID=UPI0029347511|nr:TRAP transporter substrate-binding protein [Shumkonia mesophila]
MSALTVAVLVSSGVHAEIVAKLGHGMPASHPQAVAMEKFAELVGQYTNGSVKVNVFHGAMLGSDEKQMQATQSGIQEFYMGILSPLSTRVKEIQVWDLPFMFSNTEEVTRIMNGRIGQAIFDKIEPAGLVGLSWTGIGFRDLSNSVRPVIKADDIKGLKIRVMSNPIALETWKALGANATPMAYSEVFTALEIKAIDGQENPLVHMYANKMQEVQKYISLTNHVYTSAALAASQRFWAKLGDVDKQGIEKAAKEAAVYQRQLLEKADKDVIEKFRQEGIEVDEIAPEELAKIRERTKPVVDKFAPDIGKSFIEELNVELAKIRKGAN